LLVYHRYPWSSHGPSLKNGSDDLCRTIFHEFSRVFKSRNFFDLTEFCKPCFFQNYNEIGDEGAQHLPQALQKNRVKQIVFFSTRYQSLSFNIDTQHAQY
jgi:hypothetical protein